MKRLKKVLKIVGYGCFLGILLLGVMEGIWRTQVIDLYRAELTAFNTEEELQPTTQTTVLLCGDSYTAGNYTWAYHLKSLLPDQRVINSGVSGTGIVQTEVIAKRRIREFNPEVLIYQVYVGNDLFDIRYPVNWQTVSPVKNLYWVLAQRLRSLSWLNYRSAQVFTSTTHSMEELEAIAPVKSAEFSEAQYSGREKAYLQADPDLVEDQVYLEGGREEDMERLLDGLEKLSGVCEEEGIEFYVLVIPHPAQVSEEYHSNLELVGAKFDHSEIFQELRYPFVEAIPGKVLDPLAFLREQEGRGTSVYYANDAHLNEQGQGALAEWVRGELELR